MGAVYSGTYANGIVLSNPAAQNPATVTATGSIGNTGAPAIYGQSGTAWTIDNYGMIAGAQGPGIELLSGGVIDNSGSIIFLGGAPGRVPPAVSISGAPGTLVNSGRLAGSVSMSAGGSVTNGPGAQLSGELYLSTGYQRVGPGVIISGGAGSVANLGTVSGVDLSDGGSISNGNGSATNAVIGVVDVTGAATVTNYGSLASLSISGTGQVTNFGTVAGVDLDGGGTLSNSGLIYDSLTVDGAGYIGNAGAITAEKEGGSGVLLDASGVTLANSGSIGGWFGITAGSADTAGDTIVNAGTITGLDGTAVAFGGVDDRLVVEPGAVFIGAVAGDGSTTLELAAGAGTLSGLGANFAGIGTVEVDPGASWTVSGGGPSFVNDGTLTVDGELGFASVGHDPGQHGVIDLGNYGTAVFGSSVTKGETLVFTDDTGTALLYTPISFKATVAGFAAGDVIDLVGAQPVGVSFSDHTLVVFGFGFDIAHLHFAGHYRKGEFALSPDGNGGTDITLLAPATASSWTMRG
jgi:fibronectin-binding autotransporter adhesin